MFGKVFASLWQGSMVGQSDAQLVFVYMIANCDAEGFIDQTQEVIAALTGIPLDRVRAAVEMLSAPDPRSRSTEEEGRRIVPMDDSRDWGWHIVNHAKYRAMRDEEIRRAQNREASARRRDRMTRQRESASVSRGQPPSAHAEGRGQMADGREVKGVSPERSASGDGGPPQGRQEGRSRAGAGVGASGGENGAGRAAGGVLTEDFGVVAIPLAGGIDWRPSPADVVTLRELFPGVDVAAEFRRMRAWCLAHPTRRKTRRGVRAFVTRWLDEEQNRGGRGRVPVPATPGDRLKVREGGDYREANKP